MKSKNLIFATCLTAITIFAFWGCNSNDDHDFILDDFTHQGIILLQQSSEQSSTGGSGTCMKDGCKVNVTWSMVTTIDTLTNKPVTRGTVSMSATKDGVDLVRVSSPSKTWNGTYPFTVDATFLVPPSGEQKEISVTVNGPGDVQ